MSGQQKAIVVDPDGNISLQRAPIPVPGPNDILIKVVAAAQNPSDWMASKWSKVSGAIIGFDFSGYIESIGSNVPKNLRFIGERVSGLVHAGYTPNGTFAEFVVTPARFVVPIPEAWSFEDAAQLGMAPLTALQALYESIHGLPTLDAPTTDSTPILIYGASTSVGLFTVQFAKLAGLRVIATASRANFDLVKSFGADEVFDYRSPDVSRQIKDATQNRLRYSVDCISTQSTLRIVTDALSDEGGEVAAVLQAQSLREGVSVNFSLVFELIGEDYDLPYPFRATPDHRASGERFVQLLSELAAASKIKPGPIRVMPNGLAGVPDGIQYMLDGKVSGQKLVYLIKDTPV